MAGRITYEVSQAEFRAAMTAASLPTRRHLFYFVICVAAGSALYVAGAVADSQPLRFAGVVMFTSTSFTLIGALIGNYIHMMIASRTDFASYANTNNPTTFEWDEKNIHASTRKGDMNINWQDLVGLRDRLGFLLLYFQRRICFIVPKHRLSDGIDAEEIKRLFAESRGSSR